MPDKDELIQKIKSITLILAKTKDTLHRSILHEELGKAKIELADLEVKEQLSKGLDSELGYMHYVGYTDH